MWKDVAEVTWILQQVIACPLPYIENNLIKMNLIAL